MVAHTFIPSKRGWGEASGFLRGQPGLHIEFQTGRGYIVGPCCGKKNSEVISGTYPEFEVCLGYIRPFLKKKKERKLSNSNNRKQKALVNIQSVSYCLPELIGT